MKVEFTVNIAPVAKARPRFARMGNFVRTYTPHKTEQFEQQIRAAALRVMPVLDPISGPVRMVVTFGMPIPKSWSRKAREDARTGVLRHVHRPDIDNLEKAVMDAINGALWNDDSQVVQKVSEKVYAETPFVKISVEEVDADS